MSLTELELVKNIGTILYSPHSGTILLLTSACGDLRPICKLKLISGNSLELLQFRLLRGSMNSLQCRAWYNAHTTDSLVILR